MINSIIQQKQIFFCFIIILIFFISCQTSNPDLQKETIVEIHSVETEILISAEQLTELGEEYRKKGNDLTALDYFNKAIQTDPAYALAYAYRGMLYVRAEAYTKAIKDFEEAIKLTPDPDISNSVEVIPYMLYGFCNYQLGNYEQSIADFSRVIEISPYLSDAYNFQAQAYFRLGQYQEALDKYTMAIGFAIVIKGPHDAYYLNRGRTYGTIGEYRKAINDYTESIKLNPEEAVTYIERGTVYNILEQYDEALDDFTHALILESNFMSAYLGCGIVYFNIGRYEDSVDAFNQVVRINPNTVYAYAGRGTAFIYLGEYEMAINDFNQALKLKPMDANIYKGRGIAYLHWRKYQEALNDFNESIKLNPDDEETYQGREEANRGLNSGDMEGYEFIMPSLRLNTEVRE